jgi:hypothetical protein
MTSPRRNFLAALVILAVSCGCEKKQTFPGYTYVGTDGTESGFVDLHSVQSTEDGVTFSFISRRSSGQYSILKVFSDCSNQFRRIGGTSYDPGGMVVGEVPAERQPSPLSTNAVLKKAATAACGNPIIDRPTANDNFEIGNALQALFGNYDSQAHTATWNDIDVPDRPELSNFQRTSQGSVGVAFDGAYRELGLDKHFVITWTKPAGESYDCHVCLPLLSAAIFSRQDNKWQVESEAKYLLLGAPFGQRPRCQLVKFGPEKFGVLMHYSDEAQGFETEWIVLIAAEGNAIKPIFTLTTRNDPNDALCERAPANDKSCSRYTVEYRFAPGSNAKYFDLVATKKDNSAGRSTSSTEAFSFLGDKYVSSGTAR